MNNQDNVIEVRDVKKKFKVYYDKGHTLKERAISVKRNKYEEREILKGISFGIKRGEAVGLIGHNGCGKSTTLKLLTRIMYPDSGNIEIKGRVSSLLELGAGFHPDMSGRENIYINASIFGLSKKEIESRIDDIIEFSELEEFIDNPVRTYSSGMYMRLAFSVAINVNADILLIDEILAVGDVNFQAKCFNKMMEIKNKGTTIVLVSHSMEQIEMLCDRSIWIHEGQISMDGESREVGHEYLAYMGRVRKDAVENELTQKNEEKVQEKEREEQENENVETVVEEQELQEKEEEEEEVRIGSGEARFKAVRSRNMQGEERYTFDFGEPIQFELEYEVYEKLKNVVLGLSIFRIDGVRCYGTNTKVDGLPSVDLLEDGKATIVFDDVRLLPAKYYVDVCIEKKVDDYADYWNNINEFEIISNERDIGVMRMPHSWKLS